MRLGGVSLAAIRMLVADTNIIAYLYLENEFTPLAERLLEKDPHWCAPVLWRSELRNVLALYVRKKLLTVDDAVAIQTYAESLLVGNEYHLDSLSVLQLASASGQAAYDCEFIALAERLQVPLVTTDKKLLKAFPANAIPLSSAVA